MEDLVRKMEEEVDQAEEVWMKINAKETKIIKINIEN